MWQRGSTAQAVATYAMNLRIGRIEDYDTWSTNGITRSREAESRGDFIAAADAFQQCQLKNIGAGTLNTAFTLHRLRALAALQSGRTNDALAEARRAQEALPGRADLLFDLVPRLDHAGQSQVADQLFATVWDFNADILQTYPRSLEHHQRLALLALRCNRRPDEGRAHARTALQILPQDTEFQTQLGNWLGPKK